MPKKEKKNSVSVEKLGNVIKKVGTSKTSSTAADQQPLEDEKAQTQNTRVR